MNKFWAGWISYGAIRSLIQDYWGPDKMIQMVKEDWIDASITVPLALAMIIISICLYFKEEKTK